MDDTTKILASLRFNSRIVVCKEIGQAEDTFVPENALRMKGRAKEVFGDDDLVWHIAPSVMCQFFNFYHHFGDEDIMEDHVSEWYTDLAPMPGKLCGVPVLWEPALPELGREGDVVLCRKRMSLGEPIILLARRGP